MNQPITCSAHALINALTLRGALIPPHDSQALIQKTLAKVAPLSPDEDEKPFARSRGFEIRPWRPAAAQLPTPESIAMHFAQLLQEAGPAMMTISSTLSKRDRTTGSSVAFADNPELKERRVAHRVVAIKDRDLVKVIDS